MNINLVSLAGGLYVSFNIEYVNEEIMIVASVVKSGDILHKVYKVSYGRYQNCEMIAQLLDRNFAIMVANKIIEDSIKGGVKLNEI